MSKNKINLLKHILKIQSTKGTSKTYRQNKISVHLSTLMAIKQNT